MNLKKLFIILTTILLFVGCKQFEPELCNVKVVFNPVCSYKLEETSVPKYSFVKLQLFPETGYCIDYVYSSNNYSINNVYKSYDEENTYYIFVSESEQNIIIRMKDEIKYSIYSKNDYCKIDLNKKETFAGDLVNFIVTPSNGFYYDISSITIKRNNTYVEDDNIIFSQSETNPDEYSFIMPEDSVTIFINASYGISVSSQKENFKQGEKIIFDIENKTPDATFDLVLCGDFAEYRGNIIIDSNIKLSNTYELAEDLFNENDVGCFTLFIYPHDVYSFNTSVNFVINQIGEENE